MAKKTTISVIERRLQGPSVLETPSLPIPLVDTTFIVRWTNGEIGADHAWRRINIQGWEYCAPEDIACPLDEIGAQARDGRVVRGERGKEVLVKMTQADYKKLQKLKTKENYKVTFDREKLKQDVVGAVSTEHGDKAASFINKNVMMVTDSRERVALDE